MLLAQALGASHHLVDGTEAEAGHDAADFFGNGVKEVDHVLRLALELGAQSVVEGGDTYRAVVEMALADIDAAHRDEGGGPEVVLLGPKQGRMDDVLAGAHATVGAEGDAVTETVEQKDLVGLGNTEFPGTTGVLDGAEG